MTSPLNNLTDTWNNSGTVFTGLKYNITNTASAAGSRVFDFQIGGSTFFNFDANTRIYNINDTYTTSSNYRGVFMGFDAAHNNTFMITAQAAGASAPAGPIRLSGTGGVYFWDPNFSTGVAAGMANISGKSFFYADAFVVDFANSDTILTRDAAGIFAQRNSTNAQTLRVYNTFTDSSNYERGVFDWSTTANTLTIGTQALGTGAVRPINIVGGGAGISFIHAGTAGMQITGTITYVNSIGMDYSNGDTILSRGAAGIFKFASSQSFSADGTVATVLGSLGPTGANTTVQEWLTIKNASGTTRYIPCF